MQSPLGRVRFVSTENSPVEAPCIGFGSLLYHRKGLGMPVDASEGLICPPPGYSHPLWLSCDCAEVVATAGGYSHTKMAAPSA